MRAGQTTLSVPVDVQLPSAQNNPYAHVVYFGMARPDDPSLLTVACPCVLCHRPLLISINPDRGECCK